MSIQISIEKIFLLMIVTPMIVITLSLMIMIVIVVIVVMIGGVIEAAEIVGPVEIQTWIRGCYYSFFFYIAHKQL